MPNSFSQTATLTCPQCQAAFEAEVWLILDCAEHPDLLVKLAQGVLHSFTCPQCSATNNSIDAPLLLYRTPWDRLVFSPAQGTTQEQNQEQASGLLGNLSKLLGGAWKDEWLREIAAIPRPVLPVYLLDGPEAAQQKLSEANQTNLERLRQDDPQAFLQAALQSWLTTGDIEQKRRFLEQYPELLDEAVDAALAGMEEKAAADGNRQVKDILAAHRALLERCREVGVGAAFVELNQQVEKPGDALLQDLREELSRLTRMSDMPRRIEACRKAIEQVDRAEQPQLWAALQGELGNSLAQSPLGNRAENLERAIVAYELALEVRTREAYPADWAVTQNNLALAYSDRIRGERAENLERAIAAYELALEVRTREAYPEQWAMTQNNLALAYSDRIRGERAENLERAIAAYELALEVLTREAYLEQWATTQNNLANAYSNRIHGKRAENLERAIAAYKLALEVRTREAYPEQWAMTQNNLANAYSDRIRGERAENLERAIAAYELALWVLTRGAYPEQWATTQNNLATAYNNRIRGERAENLERAIAAYELALWVLTREAYPEKWAMTQNNLASAYSDRIRGEQAENLERAIAAYEMALEVRTREAYPEQWAMTQNNLAATYKNRIWGERAENLERAIAAYELALDEPSFTIDAIQYKKTARTAGQLARDLQRWELAAKYFRQAVQADETIVFSSLSDDSHQEAIEQTGDLYHLWAEAEAQCGQVENTLAALEAGRARRLRVMLDETGMALTRLRASGYGELAGQFEMRRADYRNLLLMDRSADQSLEVKTAQVIDPLGERERAQRTMYQAAEQIRKIEGFETFLLSLQLRQIYPLAKDAPLVYLFSASSGGWAVIVRSHGPELLSLPDMSEELVRRKLVGEVGEETYLQTYLARSPRWRSSLEDTLTWLWDAGMGKVVEVLKENGGSEAVLIPTGLLGLLPLHAARTQDQTRPTGWRYVLDEMRFRYAPSARALLEAQGQAPNRGWDRLLAINHPKNNLPELVFTEDEVRSVLSHFEGNSIELDRERATKEKVVEHISICNLLHFSCHGGADFNAPLHSGLALAGTDRLTLQDFFDLRLEQARLAVLSACETGLNANLRALDEAMALPSGLIQAGVPGVVASLWSVNDLSTAMLIARFYDEWRGKGLVPQEALKEAQTWLRDSTNLQKQEYFKMKLPEFMVNDRLAVSAADSFFKRVVFEDPEGRAFEHPYFWAAFGYHGV